MISYKPILLVVSIVVVVTIISVVVYFLLNKPVDYFVKTDCLPNNFVTTRNSSVEFGPSVIKVATASGLDFTNDETSISSPLTTIWSDVFISSILEAIYEQNEKDSPGTGSHLLAVVSRNTSTQLLNVSKCVSPLIYQIPWILPSEFNTPEMNVRFLVPTEILTSEDKLDMCKGALPLQFAASSIREKIYK